MAATSLDATSFSALFNVRNKNVIVTGGALGIGFGCAKLFVEGGANVCIMDMNADALAKAEATLKTSDGGGKVVTVAGDITDPNVREQTIKACVSAFGSLDVLVNNAGIYTVASLANETPQHLSKILSVNLESVVFMTQAACKQMMAQPADHQGVVVSIASIAGYKGFGILPAYEATKAAIVQLSKSWAVDATYHARIRFVGVAPGAIMTPGVEEMKTSVPGMIDNIAATCPAKRAGQPHEIAGAVVFLSSPAASYVNGTTLVVDGGTIA